MPITLNKPSVDSDIIIMYHLYILFMAIYSLLSISMKYKHDIIGRDGVLMGKVVSDEIFKIAAELRVYKEEKVSIESW